MSRLAASPRPDAEPLRDSREPAALAPPAVPDLSVVVVNRNTRELLAACLASIRAAAGPLDVEVIVVDNGSTDGSSQRVREEFPEVRLIENRANTGYAFPNNQGLAASRGRYALLLNSDTEVGRTALVRLVEFMDAHPEAGACGPLLRYPDGRLQRSCYSVPSPRTYLATALTLDRLLPRSRVFGNEHTGFAHDRTAPVGALLGAALLVRREVLAAVGGLDERLRIHYNDFDWCLRIREAGWQVYFVHDAEVLHHLQATTRAENRHLRLQGELVRNLFDYHEKHFGRRGVRRVRLAMLLGWGARWAVFGALGVFFPDRAGEVSSRFRRGMVRAAWTGDPEQFGPDRVEIVDR